MKGAVEAFSAILITGVMIGVVGSIYFWGIPLIEKNKDINLLQGSETLIKNINSEIKNIANQGGKTAVKINVPGTLSFDGKKITFRLETSGTIYSTEGDVPLTKNACSKIEGRWGIDSPDIVCILSKKTGSRFMTTYTLTYILLASEAANYEISLGGARQSGGVEDEVIIENTGTEKTGKTTQTNIKISVI